MLGVIIGCGCTVLVVTVALAGKHYIVAQIEGVGSNLVYAGLTHSTNSFPLTLSDEISLGDMETMKIQRPSGPNPVDFQWRSRFARCWVHCSWLAAPAH